MKRLFRPAVTFAALSLALSACSADQPAPLASTPPPSDAPKAKNVILFIGDGMGISTVTAARIYAGQANGTPGEENLLSFEHFPNVALVKTYNTNQQVPDSAGTATAMNTGVKTRAGMIGVGHTAHRGDCTEGLAARLPLAAEALAARGTAIGIVSTARLTHATPAAVYAHSPERDWESDDTIPEAQRTKGCKDIAAQLTEFPFAVALGGGTRQFLGSENGGSRLQADADLPAAWAAEKGGTFVTTRDGMMAARGSDRPLLGLFSPSHMTYMLDRKADTSEPTLSEMTAAAIDKLSADPDGYYLMVEGGRIDHGHHAGQAAYALSETQEFARAVETALSKVDLSDTLILVTADHSHVFTMAGYPTRGNPILGLAMGNDEHGEPTGEPLLAGDGHPYTTLGYMNGPGAVDSLPRPAPEKDPMARQQSLIPLSSETHGGEDVALYGAGQGADGVHGVIEQNRIYDIMMRALGIETQ